jgi:hypothetical protein
MTCAYEGFCYRKLAHDQNQESEPPSLAPSLREAESGAVLHCLAAPNDHLCKYLSLLEFHPKSNTGQLQRRRQI